MVSREDKGKISSKRDRYWSVMLVGDHGRVIPFRHFKGLAITICGGFILMLIAFTVLAFLYANQMKTITALESQVVEAQLQNSKLRDEKDLYLTKLTLQESRKADKSETQPPAASPKKRQAPSPVVEEVPKPPAAKPVKKEKPVKKKAPKAKLMAEIRKFSVNYDAKQEVLKAQFRIYNTSKPKKPLSGRSVVVFKHLDEPPIKWLSVPSVPLNAGKPAGNKGQAFQIRNYLTMRFRSYRQKAPIQYNSVTAYIFSDEGQLLASKDFTVDINVPPPVKKDTVETTPKPTEEKTSPKPTEEKTSPKPKEETLPKVLPGAQDAKPQDDPTPPVTGPSQDSREKGTPKESPISEGGPAETPVVDEPTKGPETEAPEPPADRPSDTPLPENAPASGVQNNPLPTTESPEAPPKPKSEGEPR